VLVVTRKIGESIRIGDHVLVTVVKVTGSGVRLGVEAPRDTTIMRRELQVDLPHPEPGASAAPSEAADAAEGSEASSS
jgi:carbon storage regulator